MRIGLTGLTFSVALAALAAACAPTGDAGSPTVEAYWTAPEALAPIPLGAGEKLRVVATTSIVADVVGRIGGEAIDIISLVPLGVDPHAFEPTPQDVRTLAEADVVFANGFGLEAFMADLIRQAGSRAPVVSVSEGITPLPFEGEARAGGDRPDEGTVDDHGYDADPHTWFDPNNVLQWTENIEAALASLDPGHAAEYTARANAFRSDLRHLDGEIRRAVSAIPADRRKLVTDHDELGYFAEEYGFTIIGAVIPGASSLADPSAGALAELTDAVRAESVPAVFVSSVVNPSVVEAFARDTGTRIVRLYGHSLTTPDGAAPSYIDLMRYNAEAVAAALTP